MIKVIDYGVGNLGSVMNMLDYLDIPAERISMPEEIKGVPGVILPGVGAFDAAVEKLHRSGFRDALLGRAVAGEIKLLGICVGMQMLCDGSEEGVAEGMGLIRGNCIRFPNRLGDGGRLQVPHMGWSPIDVVNDHPITGGFDIKTRFYFVHSYHLLCESECVVAKAEYGVEFNAIVARRNVVGCQFHPEKSHRFGMQLFKNFYRWVME